jgi:hypothetical protein
MDVEKKYILARPIFDFTLPPAAENLETALRMRRRDRRARGRHGRSLVERTKRHLDLHLHCTIPP